MIKATKIIDPCNLKYRDIVLSRHNTGDPRVWFTFRVNETPGLYSSYIDIYPNNRWQTETYHFIDTTIFYKLSEEIGWFWGDRYATILRAMGGHFNLGVCG